MIWAAGHVGEGSQEKPHCQGNLGVIMRWKLGIERPGSREWLGIWHPESHLSRLTPHCCPHFRHPFRLPASPSWRAHPWLSSASHSTPLGESSPSSPENQCLFHGACRVSSCPLPGPQRCSKPCLTPLTLQSLTHPYLETVTLLLPPLRVLGVVLYTSWLGSECELMPALPYTP